MVSSADWSALPLLPHNQARVGVLDVIALALLENRSHAQRVAMAERLRQVLDDGLLMLGDSTTRVLYVQLCSVLNGGFSAEGLSNKNARMKAEALAGTAFVSRCRVDQRAERAKKSHANLWHISGFYSVSDYLMEPDKMHTALNASAMLAQRWPMEPGTLDGFDPRLVYLGLPVLHELWSPGEREKLAGACTSSEPLEEAYRRFALLVARTSRTAGRQLLAGLGGTLCVVCRGLRPERPGSCCGPASADCGDCVLAEAYLQNRSLESCSTIAALTARSRVAEPNAGAEVRFLGNWRCAKNVCSPPGNWWREAISERVRPTARYARCASGEVDRFLFNDDGVRHVNHLMQHELRREGIPVLDMHSATAGRCSTEPLEVLGDGKHYGSPLLQLQLSLMFRAMLSRSAELS